MQGISIIMHAHNAAAYLERSLPSVLGQDYPCFEVLVVVDNCTDLTVERLEQMEMRWPSLRHITVPASAWHPDRHRLAVLLGAKAAQHDWVLVLQPEYAPSSTLWLSHMAAAITPHNSLVIGYNSIEVAESATERFVTAFEQWFTLPLRRTAAADSNTLARREQLLQGTPHNPKSASKVMRPDTAVRRVLPYGNMWWSAELRRMRRHNTLQGLLFRIMHALAVWQAWIVTAATALLVWYQCYWPALALYALWLLTGTTLFAIFCHKVGERPFILTYGPRCSLLPLQLRL